LEKAKDGNDIVLTIHKNRAHGIIKNIFSKIFHRVFNWLAGNKNPKGGAQYGTLSLLTRKVVQAFSEFNDYHRHYLPVIRWLGFSKIEIMIDHEERFIGKSSYSFKRLIILALDGIISQTDKLLRYSIYIGFSFIIIGFFAIVYIVLLYFYREFQSGWASMVVLIIFSTGLILMSLGVVGIYIGKIFDQVKDRPLFIIEKKINV